MRSTRSAAAFFLPLVTAIASAQAAPRFEFGDPAELSCRVVKVERVEDTQRKQSYYGSLVTVEVRNPTARSAEPVVFELTAKKDRSGQPLESIVARRFKEGVYGRAGRAIPAGGTLRYTLQVMPDLPKRGVRARVRHASFFDGAGVDTLRVKVRDIERDNYVEGNVMTRDARLTRCTVRNPLDQTVDLAFVGTIAQPFDGAGIFRVRLAPHEEKVWEIKYLRVDQQDRCGDMQLTKLQLIDWSVLRERGSSIALDEMRELWKRWPRLPDGIELHGAYAFDANEAEVDAAGETVTTRVQTSGRFRIAGLRDVTVEPGDDAGREHVGAVREAVRAAFQNVRRPAVDDYLDAEDVFLVSRGDETWLGFGYAKWDWRTDTRGGLPNSSYMVIRDGALTRTDVFGANGLRETWQMQRHGGGLVVVGTKTAYRTDRWSYADLGDLIVPATFSRSESWGEHARESVRLTLSSIERGGGDVAELPVASGPAADALRVAWDASYRYPSEPTELSARFAFEDRGQTEALWAGVKKLSGSLTLYGFDGSRYTRSDVDVKPVPRRDEAALDHFAAMVLDRFRIWAGRDFCARRTFDREFRGATISESEPGVFSIENGRWAAIEVANGRVAALVWPGGFRREFHYQKFGADFVATKIVSGDEVVRAKYSRIGDWLVPVDFKFERVFGKDWGPELLKFSKVRLK